MPGPLAHIRQLHRGDPAGHLAHAPQIVPLDTRSGAPLLDLAGLIDRPDPQAPPAAATAGGSRWVRCGVRSPACSAIVHPFRFTMPPDSAATYLPTCSQGSARTKHGLSNPSRSPHSRAARAAPILAAAAAFGFVVVTHAWSTGGCTPVEPVPHHGPQQVTARMDAAVLGIRMRFEGIRYGERRAVQREVGTLLIAISCPDCSVPAEITERFSRPSTDGPIDHIALCLEFRILGFGGSAGHACIAAALRQHARRPGRPLRTIMNCLTTVPGHWAGNWRRAQRVRPRCPRGPRSGSAFRRGR